MTPLNLNENFWSFLSKLGDITEINQNCGFVAIKKTSRKSLQSTICEGAPVSHNSHTRVGEFDYNGNNLQLSWWLAPLSTAAFQWKDGSFTYYQSSTPLPVNREPHTITHTHIQRQYHSEDYTLNTCRKNSCKCPRLQGSPPTQNKQLLQLAVTSFCLENTWLELRAVY